VARKIFGKISVEGGIPQGANLRVLTWDANMDDDYIGTADVALDGSYSIEYRGGDWDKSPLTSSAAWRPDIFTKVHRKDGSGVLHRSLTRQNVMNLTGVRIDAKIE